MKALYSATETGRRRRSKRLVDLEGLYQVELQMKRPRSHEIDDRANAIFRMLKPVELAVVGLHPDYAKDYLVEISDSKEMSGDEAIVQLKGQEALVALTGGTAFSFMLEQKHALYYADKEKLPVFLVLVDVNK